MSLYRWLKLFSTSIQKGYVARRHVEQVDAHFLERLNDPLYGRPALFELLTLLCLPISPNLRREFGPSIKMCPGEV
jgi:hypothetical protein